MVTKKSVLWRILHSKAEMRVFLYFLFFSAQVIIYTDVFFVIYPMLEGKSVSWVQALMFVLETITTTGYGELLPFHNEMMNVFAMVVMLSGVMMIFMIIPLLITPYLVSLLTSAPPWRTPRELHRHTVIVGYGELARSLIESLMISSIEIVIVERDEHRAREISKKYLKRAYVIWGDYDDPSTWEQAWVKNAASVIVCEEERTTASVILGIRGITNGRIIAVVDKLSFDRYLRYAGAEYVLSPKHATGRILARHAVLNPRGDTAAEIPGLDRLNINLKHELERELRLINIPVVPGCKAAGKTLKELSLFERFGIVVLFLWKSGTFIPEPQESESVDNMTSLFLFGGADAIGDAIREEFTTDGTPEARAVIAGYGDVGAAVYHELQSSGVSCTVVDLKRHGVNEVVGNAEDEHVLKEAHIEQAQFCIVALNNDDVNIFTTLMARNLNPDIRILARANEATSVDRLYRAGADYVALLPTIGGQIIGRIVLSDIVTILLDLPDGKKVVMKHVMGIGAKTVGTLERESGVRVVGIEGQKRTVVAPPPQESLVEGDAVIAVSEAGQLKRFIHAI